MSSLWGFHTFTMIVIVVFIVGEIGVIVAVLSHLDGNWVNHGKGFDTQKISSYNQIDFNPIDKSIAFIASNRNSSYEIAADRIYSFATIAATYRNFGKERAMM